MLQACRQQCAGACLVVNMKQETFRHYTGIEMGIFLLSSSFRKYASHLLPKPKRGKCESIGMVFLGQGMVTTEK